VRAAGNKILHLVDSEGVYGAEQVLLNIAAETERAGKYEPLVGCIVRNGDEPSALFEAARESGLPAVKVRLRNALLPGDALIAGTRLRRQGVFLTHAHGYKPSVVGAFMRACCGIEVVATCHLWYPGLRPPLKYRVMTRLERLAYRRYKAIVAVSEPIRQKLVGWGVPRERVHLIRNGIALERYAARNADRCEELRRSLRLGPEGKLILTVGRLVEQKNQRLMIDALGRTRLEGLDAHLAIAGEGPLRAALEAHIAARGLNGAVTLLGYRDDVREWMQAADLFALVSRDEGLPVCLLEAMASGLPAVASPVGDVPELICSEVEGLLVEPGDLEGCTAAFVRMLSDAAFARRCAQRALDKVRAHYSSAAMYREYERVYDLFRPGCE
jgi:glycosyltransferase involved in cell wall biosynthesis